MGRLHTPLDASTVTFRAGANPRAHVREDVTGHRDGPAERPGPRALTSFVLHRCLVPVRTLGGVSRRRRGQPKYGKRPPGVSATVALLRRDRRTGASRTVYGQSDVGEVVNPPEPPRCRHLAVLSSWPSSEHKARCLRYQDLEQRCLPPGPTGSRPHCLGAQAIMLPQAHVSQALRHEGTRQNRVPTGWWLISW